jgi:chorismate mutase/prephenate dehydrogenase
MGRLLARFFRARGWEVLVSDPAGAPRGFAAADLSAARDASVVLVAASLARAPEAMESVLDERPRGLLLDIASVKAPLLGPIARARANGVAVASVHPMFGPDARSVRGRDLVVCDAGDPSAARRAERLFTGAGLRIFRMPLEEHDAVIAKTLGLAHLVGLAAASALAGDPPPADVPAATSYRLMRALAELVLTQHADLTFAIQAANPRSREVASRLAGNATTLAGGFRGSGVDAFAKRLEAWRAALGASKRVSAGPGPRGRAKR